MPKTSPTFRYDGHQDPKIGKPADLHQKRGHRGPEDCKIIPYKKITSKDSFGRLLMKKKDISDDDLIENELNKNLG